MGLAGLGFLGFNQEDSNRVPTWLLAVAGGGGGANYFDSGGGGAGGFYEDQSYVLYLNETYTVTIGVGGWDANGGNTVFDSLVLYGGGKGGPDGGNGVDGGSGGGSGNRWTTDVIAGQPINPLHGNAGGVSYYDNDNAGGGGGGADGAGQSPVGSNPASGGPGGAGRLSSITGTPLYYAGGGGGGSRLASPGPGGSGVGGNGGFGSNAATAPVQNTGSGGGGSTAVGGLPTAGADGTLVVRFPTARAKVLTFTGTPSITTDGDYTILRFNASGTFTLAAVGDDLPNPPGGTVFKSVHAAWYISSGDYIGSYDGSTRSLTGWTTTSWPGESCVEILPFSTGVSKYTFSASGWIGDSPFDISTLRYEGGSTPKVWFALAQYTLSGYQPHLCSVVLNTAYVYQVAIPQSHFEVPGDPYSVTAYFTGYHAVCRLTATRILALIPVTTSTGSGIQATVLEVNWDTLAVSYVTSAFLDAAGWTVEADLHLTRLRSGLALGVFADGLVRSFYLSGNTLTVQSTPHSLGGSFYRVDRVENNVAVMQGSDGFGDIRFITVSDTGALGAASNGGGTNITGYPQICAAAGIPWNKPKFCLVHMNLDSLNIARYNYTRSTDAVTYIDTEVVTNGWGVNQFWPSISAPYYSPDGRVVMVAVDVGGSGNAACMVGD